MTPPIHNRRFVSVTTSSPRDFGMMYTSTLVSSSTSSSSTTPFETWIQSCNRYTLQSIDCENSICITSGTNARLLHESDAVSLAAEWTTTKTVASFVSPMLFVKQPGSNSNLVSVFLVM